jgi:hypothetical protein
MEGNLMFVIPMVGLSSRFFSMGYEVPKYQLPLNTSTVFTHVIESFRPYYEKDEFYFLCRNDYDADLFIRNELNKIGIKKYKIKTININTKGQAETVYIGLKEVPSTEELYIFNIDTFLLKFRKSNFDNECQGYLEVFHGDGDHWSFVYPGNEEKVLSTTEKIRISNLCCNGLYYFKSKEIYDEIFDAERKDKNTINGEFYIAPLYNRIIAMGGQVNYKLVDESDVIACGTPEEYKKLFNKKFIYKH